MTSDTETTATGLSDALAHAAEAVEAVLEDILPGDEDGPESRLFEAMRYSTLGGGKRFRPFLVMASAELFGVPEAASVRVGAAVELIHAYSLIHDDLPCMDDDPMRRGKPSCHVAFDEATAVLTGDALMPLAFAVLADGTTHPDAAIRAELVVELANAAGGQGMVGGQMIDLAAEHQKFDIGEITRLERMKTGALISFSCEAGAIIGRATETERKALHAYAHDLGLAFQIADDLLDVEGTAETVGKAVGKDAVRGKATFVSILGVEQARDQAGLLADQAAAHLEIFHERAILLKEVARFVVERPS